MTDLINEFFLLYERFDPNLKTYFSSCIILYIPFLITFMKKKIYNKINTLDKMVVLSFLFSFFNGIILYNQLLKEYSYTLIISIVCTLVISYCILSIKEI